MTIYEKLGNILIARKLHAHTYVYACLSKYNCVVKNFKFRKDQFQ